MKDQDFSMRQLKACADKLLAIASRAAFPRQIELATAQNGQLIHFGRFHTE